MSNNIATLQNVVYGVEKSFVSVQASKTISFHREAEFAMQALSGNDYLAGIAMKNQQSLVDAITNVSALGISLNPAEKQAYLVPRDGRICLDISYMGLIDLATSSGSIMWAKAELVYENDTFRLNGTDQQPMHQRDPFSTERGAVVGAYCVAKLPNGDYLTETMSAADLNNIRDRSQGFKSGKSSPWRTDEGEMQRKTVVKRAYKYWPASQRLAQAIEILNTQGEGLEDQQKPAGIQQHEMDALISRVAAADTITDLEKIWKDGSKAINDGGCRMQYQTFKSAVTEKKKHIEENTVEG